MTFHPILIALLIFFIPFITFTKEIKGQIEVIHGSENDTVTTDTIDSICNYAKDQIRDLVLIYQGGAKRIDWTIEQFEPYVTHLFADGSRKWTFDGFLFLDFNDGMGNTFIPQYGMNPGGKKHWEWYLNRLFERGKSLDALDACITKYKSQIGNPGFKHKVVLSIPTPIPGDKNWGRIDGKALDFSNDNYHDMAVACRWYIDKIIALFYEQKYQNIELSGLYWVNEDVCHTHELTKYISPMVHERNLEFVWIPYYKGRGYERWKEFGFDIAYHQPNHFFDKTIPDSRLDDACHISSELGMALELEFDSNARYNINNSSYMRLKAYIDAFKRNGVFSSSAIAYYTGSKGLIDFIRSKCPENQRITDELFRIIIERRNNTNLNPIPKSKPKGIMKVQCYRDTLDISCPIEDGTHTIRYLFNYCMANHLYTFSLVEIDGKVVNDANYSDNIGPFLLSGGWTGGNHLLPDGITHSASTKMISITIDGKSIGNFTSTKADEVKISVSNELKMPSSPDKIFAMENITYTVKNNSIDVAANHTYMQSTMIIKYYGMQSMMVGETHILTPNGFYRKFTPITQIHSIYYQQAPNFNLFIEKSPICYQSSYLHPEGLGSHERIAINDMVFIGNSWGKCYHKLMGNSFIQKTNTTRWHGTYSWTTHYNNNDSLGEVHQR